MSEVDLCCSVAEICCICCICCLCDEQQNSSRNYGRNNANYSAMNASSNNYNNVPANRQDDIWNISGRVNQENPPVTRQPDVVQRPFEGVSVIATKQHEDDPPTYEEAMAISRENLRATAPPKET